MAQRMEVPETSSKYGLMKTEPTTQTAQEFMDSYLREKAELMKLDHRVRGAFEEKFYSEEIMKHSYYSREKNEELNREMLSEIAVDGDVAKVVTTMPAVGRKATQRYHLRMAGERWQICCSESPCIHCNGPGQIAKGFCSRCGGTGWKD